MSYKSNAIVIGILGATACALQAGAASAASLSYEETSGGRVGNGTITSFPTLPVSDTYKDTFLAPTTGTVPGTTHGFFDDFIFTVGTAHADAITSTINFQNVLAIDNLTVRLYGYNGQPSSLPLTGNSGAMTGWSNTQNIAPGVNTTVSVLDDPHLNPGTYVLEIAGTVTGSSGGSYSGSLDLTPVPLPAALPLILSGLGLLGGVARHKPSR